MIHSVLVIVTTFLTLLDFRWISRESSLVKQYDTIIQKQVVKATYDHNSSSHASLIFDTNTIRIILNITAEVVCNARSRPAQLSSAQLGVYNTLVYAIDDIFLSSFFEKHLRTLEDHS